MSTAIAESKSNGVQTARKVPTVESLLVQYKGEIARALPKHMTADRMTRIALTELRKNPDLASCCPYSFMGAVVQASQLGLEIGGHLGHAYLVPFNNNKSGKKEVQMIPGYRGLMDLARRSKQVTNLYAHAVYEGDRFHYELGLEQHLSHVPDDHRPKAAKLTHVYAVAKMRDADPQFCVLSAAEIAKVAKNSGPWRDHFEEMAKKTAIRRLFKYLPASVEMQRAVMADELADAGVSQDNALVLDSPAFKVTEEREPGEESEADVADRETMTGDK